MCNCKNIEIGSYKNQIEMKGPSWSSHRTICVDRCLSFEIQYLWNNGIITTGCCCGHNKGVPYIGVKTESIQKMYELGYKHRFNELRPHDNDSFHPRSL